MKDKVLMADFLAGAGAASHHYLDFQELKKDAKVPKQVRKLQLCQNFQKRVKNRKKPVLEMHQNKID